jgi:putative mRNA 3-end processing factor
MGQMSDTDLLIATSEGLFCPKGRFHIDPWAPVARAVITHAHSDHVTAGCGSYLCSATGAGVLRERLGTEAPITGAPFGSPIDIEDVRVSLHPAGHILGSAQVHVEPRGSSPTWVFSGDYKTAPDLTCEPFEPVRCDVFITESTFGLPIYRWDDQRTVFEDINAWWRANAAQSRTSIIFAYALGKAQRVLAGVDASIGPIALHGAVHRFNEAYRSAGISLPAADHAAGDIIQSVRGRGLLVAPPSALGSTWMRKFAGPEGISAAFVSGWMQVRGARRRKAIDRGFVLSDHADWPGLLGAIRDTGASRVGVTHGYVRPMVRWLSESGLDSFAVPTRYSGEVGEDGATEADAP